MNIKLWGVRGSLPAPYTPETVENRVRRTLESFFAEGHARADEIASFLEQLNPEIFGGFGGNTACVSISSLPESSSAGFAPSAPGVSTTSLTTSLATSSGASSTTPPAARRLIIDGGSGLRQLGEELMHGPCGRGQGEVDLFFTHFHWDHLIGLPFFAPLFVPGNRIRFYAVQANVEECVRAVFKKPFFPVPFEALASTITFHHLVPRTPIMIGALSVTPYQLDHPDPCWGYRVESEGRGGLRSYAHCVDTECTRITREDLGLDLPLYQNLDLALFDAQYTLKEAQEKANWGHASGPVGVELAIREGIKNIIFAHHDPAASDERIAEAMRETQAYFDAKCDHELRAGRKRPLLKWSFAREGQEFNL